MCRFLYFFLLPIVFLSCAKKSISNNPFYVTEKITCDDLYEKGYKWLPGVDVTLLGKKFNDTTISYQIHKKIKSNTKEHASYDDYLVSEEEIGEETKLDTVKEIHEYQKYINQDPLILSDSIYTLVWGDLKKQQKQICKDCEISYRYFKLKIKESEIDGFTDKIDIGRYKVINEKEEHGSYKIREFKVVNLFKKDTFDCYFYENNKEFYFSSTKKIN